MSAAGQEHYSSPWNDRRIASWREGVIAQGKRRDYAQVVQRIQSLPANTHIIQCYGHAVSGAESHALYSIRCGRDEGNPDILLIGGTHGYEPSGVEAILRFMRDEAPALAGRYNIDAYPCINPWAYEYDQRWNWHAWDTNRQFVRDGRLAQNDECRYFMDAVEGSGRSYQWALDLHETSDRDIDLRQKRAKRFGEPLDPHYRIIPQGYHVIVSRGAAASVTGLNHAFAYAIVARVRAVSPIAQDATIMKQPNLDGVVIAEAKQGLLRAYLGAHAALVGVTEAYPDHPSMTPEKTVQAQLAAIRGAFDFRP